MWYAKRPLPGAAPSPEFQFPEEDWVEAPITGDPVMATPLPAAKPSSARSAAPRSLNLQSLMAPPAEAKHPAPVAAPEPALESAPESALPHSEKQISEGPLGPQTAVAVHLGFWSTDKTLLISQWSDEASERLQDALAGNLLKALHEKEPKQRRMLHWPVFRNPQIPGNSTEDFREVLSRMLAPHDQCSIILLGVMATEPDAQRHYCLQALLARADVDFAHSLAELSASPSQKRDLWHALKSCYAL